MERGDLDFLKRDGEGAALAGLALHLHFAAVERGHALRIERAQAAARDVHGLPVLDAREFGEEPADFVRGQPIPESATEMETKRSQILDPDRHGAPITVCTSRRSRSGC